MKDVSFETAIIERYQRRESSVEEAIIEMYLAGVSVRRVEDITEVLWGSEDKASWVNFFQWLRGRGLDGVKLIIGDKCLGMLEVVEEVFPDAKYQRCVVHFYRNVFSVVPKFKVKLVAKMLKAIHAKGSKKAAREKAKAIVAELKAMKLKETSKRELGFDAGLRQAASCGRITVGKQEVYEHEALGGNGRLPRRLTSLIGAPNKFAQFS